MNDTEWPEVTEKLHLEGDVRSLNVRIDECWSIDFYVKLNEVEVYVENQTDENYYLYWGERNFVATDDWRDAVISEMIRILFYQPYNMDADRALNLILDLFPTEGHG